MNDDKVLEPRLARNRPGLVVAFLVVCVEEKDGRDVDGSEDDWHFWAQSEVEEILVNSKRRAE